MVRRGLMLFSVLLLVATGIQAQQNATVTVNATIQSVAILRVDGTDANNTYTTAETINFGNVDAIGTVTTGDFTVTGTPVDASLNPLTDPLDPTCVGSFYEVYTATGGNSYGGGHPNAALGIRARTSRVATWTLSVAATLTTGTTNVTVGQLRWKDDSAGTYTAFTAGSTTITSGTNEAANVSAFHDYGLLIEFEDGTGANTWTVTYTLATT